MSKNQRWETLKISTVLEILQISTTFSTSKFQCWFYIDSTLKLPAGMLLSSAMLSPELDKGFSMRSPNQSVSNLSLSSVSLPIHYSQVVVLVLRLSPTALAIKMSWVCVSSLPFPYFLSLYLLPNMFRSLLCCTEFSYSSFTAGSILFGSNVTDRPLLNIFAGISFENAVIPYQEYSRIEWWGPRGISVFLSIY